MKKKLSKNNLKFIILVFIFLIGIGTFLVQESFAKALPVDVDDGGGGGGGGYTPPTPPAPTINVKISSSVSTVAYGGSATVTWSSTGAIACTRSDTGASIGISGSFSTGPLYSSKTLTITCTKDSYCSGSYIDTTTQVDWNNEPYVWKNPYGVYGGGYISDRGCNCGVVGDPAYRTDGTSWYQHICVEHKIFGLCISTNWSVNSTFVRSGYATKSCVDFPQSSCSSTSGCTWHP